MLLVYDHENVLHITNEKGLRWNYEKTQKPQFLFDYEYLFYIGEFFCRCKIMNVICIVENYLKIFLIVSCDLF